MQVTQYAIDVANDIVRYDPRDDEDGDTALSLILELEHAVASVITLEQINSLPVGTFAALSSRLDEMFVGVSDRCVALAQIAEDEWLLLAETAPLEAYGWLDTLAVAATSRSRIAAIVKHASRVDDLMTRLSLPNEG